MMDSDEAMHSISVLYVEDDRVILESLQIPLQRKVKQLWIARNGEEGLALCHAHKPDLVISDIRMPVMDGLAMSLHIRKHYPKLPIILTSAFEEAQYLRDALAIGVYQYVAKPLDWKKLIAAISRCAYELVLEKQLRRQQAALTYHVRALTQYKHAVEEGTMICSTDQNGVIHQVSDAFCQLSGYRREELVGNTCFQVRYLEKEQQQAIELAQREGRIFRGVVKNRHRDGHLFYTNLTIVPIHDEQEQITEFLYFREDVTQLVNQIYTDPLTGYPNRAALLRALEQIESPLMVLLNIDGFSQINLFYGHSDGDRLLRDVTATLDQYRGEYFPKATLFKLAADEFALVMSAPNWTNRQADRMLHRILHRLESHNFICADTPIKLSFTLGYSLDSEEDPLANADIALRHARMQRVSLAGAEALVGWKQHCSNNLLWVQKLKQAIAEDRIVPWFQPIIDNRSQQILKYECLIRLIERDGTPVLPGAFLEVAHKSQLYYQLTKIMISKSCRAFRDKPYCFSLNLTNSDILNVDLMDHLRKTIHEEGVAKQLIIELLEWEGVGCYEQVAKFVSEMKALGCQLAIDDFGSGYSNFSHLQQLQADFIKIDGSIIRQIIWDRNSLLIVQTIAEFAHRLGVQTIAEFVENEEILLHIRQLGIEFSQGFLYGKARPEIP